MFTGFAQASYFQTDCSNADQSIKTGEGHRYDGVAITLSLASGESSIVEFENDEIVVATVEETELRKEETTSCAPGRVSGGAMSRNVWSYKKVKLSRADNKEFSENTIGVSQDRKSIDTDFICHNFFSSRTWCPQ